MRKIISGVKKSAYDSDGFLNGMIKGIVSSAALIVALAFMTGYSG